MATIFDLPNECLLQIFDYLNANDLVQLKTAYKQFEDIVDYKAKQLLPAMLMVAENENSYNNKRSCTTLTPTDRLDIGNNWLNANQYRKIYRPLANSDLVLTTNGLYASMSSFMVKFDRQPNIKPGGEAIDATVNFKYLTLCSAHITDFVVKGDILFEVRTTGQAHLHDSQSTSKKFMLYYDSSTLSACDFHGTLYATATDLNVNLWSRVEGPIYPELSPRHQVDKGYSTIRYNQDGSAIFGGDYYTLDKLDIESLRVRSLDMTQDFFQLKSIKDQSLLALSLEGLFLYDERCERPAQKLFKSRELSCFDTDGIHGVVLGMNNTGGIKLFDMRMLNKTVQTYYTNHRGSKVNGLACDTRYLFCNCNRRIHVFDFKTSF